MGSTVEAQEKLLKTKPKVSRKTEGPEVPFEDDLSPPRASSMYSPEDWGAISGSFKKSPPGYNFGFKASDAKAHPVTFKDQSGTTGGTVILRKDGGMARTGQGGQPPSSPSKDKGVLMSAEKKALRSAKWIQSKAEQIYDVLSGDFDQRHGSTLSQIKKRLKSGESPAKIQKSIQERNPTNPNVLLRGRQRTSWPHLKEGDSKRSEAVEMHDGGIARKTRVF